MSAATEAKPLFSKGIVVADHFRLQLVRTVAEDGDEEIIGTVPATWDFGDWRRDEPDAGKNGPLHPHPAAILKDCSREIGFDLVYRELDDGVDYADDGTITLTFERAPEAAPSLDSNVHVNSDAGTDEKVKRDAAPETPRLQGLSEVELLRRQLDKANRQIAHYREDQIRRRRKAQSIAQLRQVVEEDKKRLAGSKADLEEAVLGWCNEEAAEEPLWDYAARSETALPPTNGVARPANHSANGESAKGSHGGQPPADDESWRKEPLAVLGLTDAILKKLDANDPPLRTVGDLQQLVERLGKEGFTDPIAQIKGIGAKTAEKIDVAFQEFWSKRPVPAVDCPKADPSCPSTDEECHDSCEAAEPAAMATSTVDDHAKALTAALTSTQGAAERWARLQESGATDAQLKAAIATEFGNGGGGSNPASYYHEGGKQPKFWLGDSREGKPTLAGKALLAKVREVMGVPEGGEEVE